jgi:hypothetical protein
MGKWSPVIAGGGGCGGTAKRSFSGSKKRAKVAPQWVTVTTSYDDDDDKEAEGSDEEHVAGTKHDFKCQVRQLNDHFVKLPEATCPSHASPIKHKHKECTMMKNYMTLGALSKGKKPEGDPRGKAAAPFPGEEAVMSIYGRPVPHELQHKLKLTSRTVNDVNLATPEYLQWSKSLITFDWIDHPNYILKMGRFPLIVDPLVGTTQLTKSLMDGGSVLNLTYLNTFKGLGLGQNLLKTISHPFYGVVSCKKSILLGQINLSVTSRDVSNYRIETLTFEVVDFSEPYQFILGRPCYIKFMAIPSYSYLKLKITRPADIITVEAKGQRTLDYEQNSIELAVAAVATTKLKEMCLNTPPSLTNPVMSSTFDTFKAVEDAKAIQIDIEDPAKTVQIRVCLSPKLEGKLVDFL